MTTQPTVRDILRKTETYFLEKGVDSPRLCAQVLVSSGLGLDRLGLFMDMDRPLRPAELDSVRPLVARRGKGEPLAYIIGEREFFSLAFEVGPDVLIPRPETEMLVEQALALHGVDEAVRFADLGTGSGCLAVTLAVKLPASHGTALDLSPGALAIARRNAARHGVEDRLSFVQDTFSGLPSVPGGYHLVVSNPPYVSQEEFAELSVEVARFEPLSALVPGEGGLEAYPEVAAAAHGTLAPGGVVMLEIGWRQGQAVRGILESAGFKDAAVLKDLAGLDRVVTAVKGG